MAPTMTDNDRIAELEALLREEREFRHAAESRVQALTDKAELWRRRAEERSARIERLLAESELPGLRRVASRVRRALRVGSAVPASAVGYAASTRRPVYPGVRIAAAVTSPGIASCLATADVVEFDGRDDAFADADVVVVEPAAFRALGDATRGRLIEWAALDARQPLVVWTTGDVADRELTVLARRGDVVATTRAAHVDPLARHADHPAVHLGESLDPARHVPGHHGNLDVTARLETGVEVDGDASDPAAIRVDAAALADPPGWLVALAALGVPVLRSDDPTSATAEWAGAAATRWAYRRHAPWVRLGRLLDHAGLDVPDPTPVVSALLVSRRRDAVPEAIARIAAQTHRPLELVVALHGATASREITAAMDDAGVPTILLELDSGLSLGACLNRAADAATGSVVAKIDDDDHYGPGYLEDAVHALRYTGAGVVVKAAQYTYLAARNETVLRRARQEHVYLDGSTQGATFIARRDVWQAVKFPHRTRGEDLRFLRGVRAIGASVYAGSRWEFCYVRQAGHTWTAADETFLAGSAPAWTGFDPSRVEVPDLERTA